jgi:hypothetical protein
VSETAATFTFQDDLLLDYVVLLDGIGLLRGILGWGDIEVGLVVGVWLIVVLVVYGSVGIVGVG